MTKAKRKRHGAFLCAVLAVLAAAVLRLIGFQVEDPLDWTCAFARSVIYIVLFAAWGISVRGRIIQPQTRRCLTARSKSGKAVCKSPWIKGRRFNTAAPFLRASDPSEPARPDSFSTVPLTGADAAPAVFS